MHIVNVMDIQYVREKAFKNRIESFWRGDIISKWRKQSRAEPEPLSQFDK